MFGFDDDFGSLSELVDFYRTNGFRKFSTKHGDTIIETSSTSNNEQSSQLKEGKPSEENEANQVETRENIHSHQEDIHDSQSISCKQQNELGIDESSSHPADESIDAFLECTHALNLGDIDKVAIDGIDPAVKRLPKLAVRFYLFPTNFNLNH